MDGYYLSWLEGKKGIVVKKGTIKTGDRKRLLTCDIVILARKGKYEEALISVGAFLMPPMYPRWPRRLVYAGSSPAIGDKLKKGGQDMNFKAWLFTAVTMVFGYKTAIKLLGNPLDDFEPGADNPKEQQNRDIQDDEYPEYDNLERREKMKSKRKHKRRRRFYKKT